MWHMGHMIAFDLRAAAPAADPGEFGPVPRSSTLVVVVVVVVFVVVVVQAKTCKL